MKCMLCPVEAPGATCLGESVPRLCVLAETRADYRRRLAELAYDEALTTSNHPLELSDVLGAVSTCIDRGAVLPASLQPECGCAELTECRAGRGSVAGRVTLQDCIACLVKRRGENQVG